MAHHESGNALLVGFLSAREARPDVQARFDVPQSGTALSAGLRFLGRKLPAGATLELDAVCLAAHPTIYDALERYGDAAAATSAVPVRSGSTSLWCSWYAHRMAMTEDLVLANAAVAAQHFQPLGLEIMQLDHGWQRGDITGDWVVNERFPHGLKWLADQLRSRHGLHLGVWISPTDVAETSATFRDHPEWMLKDDQGQPAVSWQWYWKPNPNCYQLDASHPDAAAFIRDTFARLTAEGVSYYKIDFIAPCGGEHFVQHDPYCTRGWGVLRRAMEAIREGAGPGTWIRYCQTPPLLSAGLANSAYGGSDTLDAGLKGQIDVLRTNARSLAAGYWLNDRLYHREVCDMSVRMQAPIEEVRLRLALMALAGCSISLSDELTYLPLSRIRMAQQVLPPGVPAMKPLDLLQRDLPSVWHLPCRTEAADWDVVGLFNFEAHPETRTIELSQLGLMPKSPVVAFEFWEERLLGIVQDRLSVLMPPQSSRIVLLHRLSGRPQLIGTNMHVLGGWHEVRQLAWDETQQSLSGRYRRAPGLEGRAFFYVPPPYEPRFTFPLDATAARLTNVGEGLWMQEVKFAEPEFDWAIPFQRSDE
jgi:alpha-galactosidase